MGPPRLTLVPRAAEDAAAAGDTGHASAAARDREVAAGAEPPRDAADPSRREAREAEAEVDAAPARAAAPGEPAQAVDRLAAASRAQKLRIVEAVLFAAPEPIDVARIAQHLDEGDDVASLVGELRQAYAERGINLVSVAGKWAFRTAEDLSFLLQRYAVEERRLSRAALETLSIVAYHQPVTRAEIEEIRGVSTSSGTIDLLLETGWIRPRGRRRAPGRPVTYGTTESFLDHFGFASIKDLPGLAELKGAGLLDATLPPGFSVPEPNDVASLLPDELPLDDAGGEAEADQADQGELGFEPLDVEPADGSSAEPGEPPPDLHGRGDDQPGPGPDSDLRTAAGDGGADHDRDG